MDLKDQREGEATIFFKSDIIRAKLFYANPKPVKAMRLNQFLKVDAPLEAVLVSFDKNIKSFENRILNGGYFGEDIPVYDDLNKVADVINNNIELPPIEKAVSALLSYHDREVAPMVEDVIELPTNELNIFSELRMNDYLAPLLLKSDEEFRSSILNSSKTRDQIGYIERVLGKSEQYSSNIASEIIRDMQSATHYPPVVASKPTGGELAHVIGDLISGISLKKEEKSKGDTSSSLFEE